MSWARIEAAPNRKELIELYRDLVHPGCPDVAVITMPDRHMIKAICTSVYLAYYKSVAKWRIIKYLSEAFCIPDRTIYSYMPTLEGRVLHQAIRVWDKAGVKLGEFKTVKEASAATGVSKEGIYKAMLRGGTSGGYHFNSDMAKPTF